MADPSIELQTTVFAALSSIGSVFDNVPDDTPLPYIQIGDDIMTGDDRVGDWTDTTVTVHVFGSTNKTVKTMVGQARDALMIEIEMPSFSVVEYHLDSVRYYRDEGKVSHGILSVNYLIQPAG